MKGTGVHRYVLNIKKTKDGCKGMLRKKPLHLYSREELGTGSDRNEIIPLCDSSIETVCFDLASALDAFFALGNKSEQLPENLPESLGRLLVSLADGWESNPLFGICALDEDGAKDMWYTANCIAEKTDGLKCALASFERLRTLRSVGLDYSVAYSPINPFADNPHLIESAVLDGKTFGYVPEYKYTCSNVKEIIYAIFHYCVSHGYVLKRCKFCGKYFMPRAAQENFCSRTYEYSNWQGVEKKYPSCKYARESIAHTCAERRKTIRRRLYDRKAEYGMLENDPTTADFFEFEREDSGYWVKLKTDPSAENLKMYERFLFLECEKYCKRYRRRK